MADEKLNTGPAENISPEAAEPITTPEQAAASEPQQEQTGPAIPEHGYKVPFSGFAYVQADSKEEAEEKFGDDVTVYKQIDIGDVEEVDEMPIDLD